MKNNTMKAVRITFNGVPLRTVYPHATRWQVAKYRFFKAVRWFIIRAGIATLTTAALFAAFMYGSLTTPNLTAINTIIQAPIAKNEIAPILKRICMAESGCQQFAATGLPVFHANTDGSVDIGKYQINNRAWGAQAKKLGYDLMTEEGQDKMATYILENKGTGPWGSSIKGWNK